MDPATENLKKWYDSYLTKNEETIMSSDVVRVLGGDTLNFISIRKRVKELILHIHITWEFYFTYQNLFDMAGYYKSRTISSGWRECIGNETFL